MDEKKFWRDMCLYKADFIEGLISGIAETLYECGGYRDRDRRLKNLVPVYVELDEGLVLALALGIEDYSSSEIVSMSICEEYSIYIDNNKKVVCTIKNQEYDRYSMITFLEAARLVSASLYNKGFLSNDKSLLEYKLKKHFDGYSVFECRENIPYSEGILSMIIKKDKLKNPHLISEDYKVYFTFEQGGIQVKMPAAERNSAGQKCFQDVIEVYIDGNIFVHERNLTDFEKFLVKKIIRVIKGYIVDLTMR